MQELQYDRQKLYYKCTLIIGIIAILGYTFYFEYERSVEDVNIIKHNIALYIRLSFIVYFVLLLIFLNKSHKTIFNILGFLIMVPMGWGISIISFFTIGYGGIMVAKFIFLIFLPAIIFVFSVISLTMGLLRGVIIYLTLLLFYPEQHSTELYTYIFLYGLSCILGVNSCFRVNVFKKNEGKELKERELLTKDLVTNAFIYAFAYTTKREAET
jgi:hypothetical protein